MSLVSAVPLSAAARARRALAAVALGLLTLAPVARPARAQIGALTPESAGLTLAPGQSGVLVFTQSYPAAAFSFAVYHNTPPGLDVRVEHLNFAAWHSGSVTFTVHITNTSASAPQAITLQTIVLSEGQYQSGGSASIFVHPPVSGLSLSPSIAAFGVLSARQYTLTLSNQSMSAQKVSLSLLSPWPAQLTGPSVINLPGGGAIPVGISVTRPLTAIQPVSVTLIASGWNSVAMAETRLNPYRALLPVIMWPGPNVVDSYEPDNSCAQFSQIAPGQVQTRTFGGSVPDTDVIRLTLAGPGNYTLSFAGTEYRAEPRARIWTQQTCGSGNSQVYTSTSGLPVNVPLVLPPAPPYSYTLWISMTNPHYGPGTGYVISAAAGTLMTALGSATDTIVLRPGPDMSR